MKTRMLVFAAVLIGLQAGAGAPGATSARSLIHGV